ncbi:hypothetical protein Dda_5157 [Drechslerella dactyloides]|uniref:F-box domain-containing protein n=1 Tax=Drechslerella dactyloides TaxID=74499 RepID=A0AAD6IVJ7_DREDA|nr:hypothetical protein Dda_5157 [Drechslerella dactyloides]
MEGQTYITALPTELQTEILSWLPWESHLPCMQVCTLWRNLLLDAVPLKKSRFVKAGALRHHQIFAEPFGALRFSTTIDRVQSTSLTPPDYSYAALDSDDYEISPEVRAIWELRTLQDNGVLDDPVFYPTESSDDITDANDGPEFFALEMVMKFVLDRDGRMLVHEIFKHQWPVADDDCPDFRMTIRQFVQWAAERAMEFYSLKEAAGAGGRVELELHFTGCKDTEFGFAVVIPMDGTPNDWKVPVHR